MSGGNVYMFQGGILGILRVIYGGIFHSTSGILHGFLPFEDSVLF